MAKKKVELTEEEQEKSKKKKIFWARFCAYVMFGLIAPCGFIVWRFNLFNNDKHTMGGWGLIIILIVTLFATSTIKWVYKGMKFSIWKQIISGFCKVILPLLSIFFVMFAMKDSMDLFLQALGCVIGSEMIAIIANPLPQLYYETKGEEIGGLIDVAVDKFFTRKEKENSGDK